MNIKRLKKIFAFILTCCLLLSFSSMASATPEKETESTFHKTKSSEEYDSGIIPLNAELGADFVFDESDYTNPWTAPIPSYTKIERETYITKSSQEYDDGIVSLGEYKSEDDYSEWTAAVPTYTDTESGEVSDGRVTIKDVGETEDSNSNPPSSEDTTLPSTTYFRTNYQTYTDYAYSPTGSGATGGSMHITWGGDIESDTSTYTNFARKVKIYIYDFDAGSSMLFKTYSSSKEFDDDFWIGTLNADHRYFFRIKVVANTLTWWNRLDAYFRVSLT